MTDKEKQIEEMAKEIESVKLYGIDNYGRKISHDSVLELAEELLKHYQPKIPEGSVVLSKGEAQKYYAYKHIEPQIKGCLEREVKLERQLKEVRKETAREFANAMLDIKPDLRMLDGCTPSEFMRIVNLATDIIFQAVKKVAKSYGVEVEE